MNHLGYCLVEFGSIPGGTGWKLVAVGPMFEDIDSKFVAVDRKFGGIGLKPGVVDQKSGDIDWKFVEFG